MGRGEVCQRSAAARILLQQERQRASAHVPACVRAQQQQRDDSWTRLFVPAKPRCRPVQSRMLLFGDSPAEVEVGVAKTVDHVGLGRGDRRWPIPGVHSVPRPVRVMAASAAYFRGRVSVRGPGRIALHRSRGADGLYRGRATHNTISMLLRRQTMHVRTRSWIRGFALDAGGRSRGRWLESRGVMFRTRCKRWGRRLSGGGCVLRRDRRAPHRLPTVNTVSETNPLLLATPPLPRTPQNQNDAAPSAAHPHLIDYTKCTSQYLQRCLRRRGRRRNSIEVVSRRRRRSTQRDTMHNKRRGGKGAGGGLGQK